MTLKSKIKPKKDKKDNGEALKPGDMVFWDFVYLILKVEPSFDHDRFTYKYLILGNTDDNEPRSYLVGLVFPGGDFTDLKKVCDGCWFGFFSSSLEKCKEILIKWDDDN